MRTAHPEDSKLFQLAALCQEAIQAQNHRAARQGYGLDDYTEGRIVGAANLARKLLRLLHGPHTETLRLRIKKP